MSFRPDNMNLVQSKPRPGPSLSFRIPTEEVGAGALETPISKTDRTIERLVATVVHKEVETTVVRELNKKIADLQKTVLQQSEIMEKNASKGHVREQTHFYTCNQLQQENKDLLAKLKKEEDLNRGKTPVMAYKACEVQHLSHVKEKMEQQRTEIENQFRATALLNESHAKEKFTADLLEEKNLFLTKLHDAKSVFDMELQKAQSTISQLTISQESVATILEEQMANLKLKKRKAEDEAKKTGPPQAHASAPPPPLPTPPPPPLPPPPRASTPALPQATEEKPTNQLLSEIIAHAFNKKLKTEIAKPEVKEKLKMLPLLAEEMFRSSLAEEMLKRRAAIEGEDTTSEDSNDDEWEDSNAAKLVEGRSTGAIKKECDVLLGAYVRAVIECHLQCGIDM